jgi:ribosomal protein L13E
MHHIKPTITKNKGTNIEGKGFSPNEMAKAGVTKNQMQKMKMPIDYKRKSEHESNIAAIKAHAAQAKAEEKPKAAQPEVQVKKK